LNRNDSPARSASPETNVEAVTSVKATMTYTSASQMKAMIAIQARPPRCTRITSAMERPSWRTEATSVEKSWTAPMNTTPMPIQRMEGSQPNCWQARMGPAMGPAAAMAEKCWGRR
jgi:hypothetical protein